MSDHGAVNAAVGTGIPSVAAVWAFSLGIGENWPLLIIGVAAGMSAKAAAVLASGKPYGWAEARVDVLMAVFLFIVAGFLVDAYNSNLTTPLRPFAILLISAGLAIAGARVRGLVERAALNATAKALGIPSGDDTNE